MEIGTVFLILDQSLEANRDTLVITPGGELVDAFILDIRGGHLAIEVNGVPFEARPWQEGDTRPPFHPHTMDATTAWTIYGIEGHTHP
jgi:hypothetical protein